MLMDAAARRVLDALVNNPDAEISEIAESAAINENVARERVTRLRTHGLFLGRAVKLDARQVGFPHEALVFARPSARTTRADMNAIAQAPKVTRAFTLATEHSFAFTLVGTNLAAIEAQAHELANLHQLDSVTIIPMVETLSDDPAGGLYRAWNQSHTIPA